MHLNKLLLVLLSILAISCTEKPKHVYLYTKDGVELLNGHVKEVFDGESESADGFYKTKFDRKGSMDSSTEKTTSISSAEGISDTSIDIRKTKYAFQYKEDGTVKSITGDTKGTYGKGLFAVADSFKYISRWKLDKKNQLAQFTSGILDTVYTIGKYTCDSVGNVTKLELSYPDRHREPDLYYNKYDAQNHMIEKSLNDEQFLLQKTAFKYIAFDSHNNWIEREAHWQSFFPIHKDSGVSIETRKITYY